MLLFAVAALFSQSANATRNPASDRRIAVRLTPRAVCVCVCVCVDVDVLWLKAQATATGFVVFFVFIDGVTYLCTGSKTSKNLQKN